MKAPLRLVEIIFKVVKRKRLNEMTAAQQHAVVIKFTFRVVQG